jgi:hypothetical protein
MTKNVSEILQRGGKLDEVSKLSSSLSAGSQEYRKKTQTLNQTNYLAYITVAVFALVLIAIYFYFFHK